MYVHTSCCVIPEFLVPQVPMDVVTAASAKATNKAINPQTVGSSNHQVNKHTEQQRAANEQRQIDFSRQRRTYFIRKVQAFTCFICITAVYIILCGVLTSGDWAKRDVSSEPAGFVMTRKEKLPRLATVCSFCAPHP